MRKRMMAPAAALTLLALWAAPAWAASPQARPADTAATSFHSVDTDKSGRLSLDEVLAYSKKQAAQARAFRIREADLDGDGRLSVEEQRKAGITGLDGFGSVDLKELDVHGDGFVSREDLDEFFARRHREAYARADADRDRALSPAEFALFRF